MVGAHPSRYSLAATGTPHSSNHRTEIGTPSPLGYRRGADRCSGDRGRGEVAHPFVARSGDRLISRAPRYHPNRVVRMGSLFDPGTQPAGSPSPKDRLKEECSLRAGGPRSAPIHNGQQAMAEYPTAKSTRGSRLTNRQQPESAILQGSTVDHGHFARDRRQEEEGISVAWPRSQYPVGVMRPGPGAGRLAS